MIRGEGRGGEGIFYLKLTVQLTSTKRSCLLVKFCGHRDKSLGCCVHRY